MNLLTGNSEDFTVLGTLEASADDLSLIAGFIKQPVEASDVAILEAVAFDLSRNKAGWQVANLDGIDCLGASLNYDHAKDQKSSFGVIFASRNDGNRKVVKACIPKTAKNADALTDIKFKVASKTSPCIQPTEWQDERKQIVKAGRLVHLSFVQNPAYGEGNEVLSLAASDETVSAFVETALTENDKALLALGKKVHADNVTRLVRLQERRAGGFSKDQRETKTVAYLQADCSLVSDMVLLAEQAERPLTAGTTQQSVTVSEVPTGSVRKPVQATPAHPIYTQTPSNNQEIR